MHLDSVLGLSVGSISEKHPNEPRWALGSGSAVTTAEEMAHKCRNITAGIFLTGIEANKSPRNCAGSQTITALGNESAEFKNLNVLRG